MSLSEFQPKLNFLLPQKAILETKGIKVYKEIVLSISIPLKKS
jgi:hypothetical protein